MGKEREKDWKAAKKAILTSEQHAKHLFAAPNTQQTFFKVKWHFFAMLRSKTNVHPEHKKLFD
jgi:hypothetical protein